jgi:hypothetical protein
VRAGVGDMDGEMALQVSSKGWEQDNDEQSKKKHGTCTFNP